MTPAALGERRELLLSGSVARAMAVLGAPSMLMGAVQALTPFADALFVYRAAGSGAGAAVAFAGPIVGVLAAFGTGLGSAGLAVVGQANGAGDEAAAASLSRQLAVVSVAAGAAAAAAVAALGRFALGPLDPALRPEALAYVAAAALSLPFGYFQAAYNAIAQARGLAEKPLYRALLLLAAKVAFDGLFIAVLRMGALGAGLASVAANALTAAAMARDALRTGGFRIAFPRAPRRGPGPRAPRPIGPPRLPVDRAVAGRLLALGLPAAAAAASNSLSFYVMNGEAARYGTEVLNGFQIANTVNSLFFAPASAVGSAVAALAALATGAGRPERAARGLRIGLLAGLVSSALFAAALVAWAPAFARIFTAEPVPLARAAEAMRAYSVSILGFSVFQIVAGAFSGIGRTDVPLAFALLRVWILRVPAALALRAFFPAIGPYSIWISMIASNFGTAAVALAMAGGIDWTHSALGSAPRSRSRAGAGPA